jgi:hypothetical protein
VLPLTVTARTHTGMVTRNITQIAAGGVREA